MANERTLSNDDWADVGQTFAEQMGLADHPWMMVRHGEDHVHLVISWVSDFVRSGMAAMPGERPYAPVRG